MRNNLLVSTILLFSPVLTFADSLTITEENSSLKFTRDDSKFNLGVPNDPVQLPRTLEWTVDGRRILVYPSSPSTSLDIGHLHPDQHLLGGNAQMHAQGPFLTFGTGPISGNVIGSIVYTVDGGISGSGSSRISEKVDLHNKTNNDVIVTLFGLGRKPTKAGVEIPNLTGLNITGTTVVYYQGVPMAGSLTEGPPFAPLTVLPVVSFSGFNPFYTQSFKLPAGAFLTMITELKVSPGVVILDRVWLVVVGLVALATVIGVLVWRQRSQR